MKLKNEKGKNKTNTRIVVKKKTLKKTKMENRVLNCKLLRQKYIDLERRQ
jgi:hypothetical protein